MYRYLSVSMLVLALTAPSQAEAIEGENIEENGEVIDVISVTGQLSDFGATKSATPILETARSVSIETEEMFRNKGALTLDDTLSYTSGVLGDSFGFSTRGDFAYVRGFDAAEYRDGQQVLFGYYNNTRSDVYMLEQVEVLKGPASVLYGKGTPGGIFNAVSKLAGPDKESEIVFDAGSYDRYQLSGDFNAALTDNLFVRMVGVARSSDTQVDYVEDDALIFMPSITYDNGTTRVSAMVEVSDRDSDTSHQFLPLTGSGCVDSGVQVSVTAVCANASGSEVSSSTYLGDPDFNHYNTDSVLTSLLVSHEFSDAFSVDGIFRYKDGEADYAQAWIDFLGNGVPRVDANGDGSQTFYWSQAHSEQTAFDLRARYMFETGALEHEVFAGLALQDVTYGNRYIYLFGQGSLNIFDPVYGGAPAAATDPSNFYSAGDTETEDFGLYINDQVSVGNWKINFGVRYDEVETKTASVTQKDDATSYSVGALYAFESGFSPYVSYAQSFEPVIGTDGFTNNPLKPREGEQWEVGVKYQPAGTRTYVTAAYFEIEESNLPNPSSLVGQPNSQQEGVGKVTGFEIEAQTTFGDWYLEGNLSVLDTNTPDQESFSSVPDQQSSVWVQYQPEVFALTGFKAGGGLRYVGDSQSSGDSYLGPLVIVTEGQLVGDLMIGVDREDWSLTATARNFTDEEYYSTCLVRGDCFPGERRTLLVRLARRF